MESFSAEHLNYLKFCITVLHEIPAILRRVFVSMWDTLADSSPGFLKWDDSTTVRNMFLAKEGGKIDYVPTDKSYLEWDCTALFQATLFSQTFALPDGYGKRRMLYELYVKTPLTGTFHDCVLSPTGNTAETCALALDQLRLLRNMFCHQSSSMQKIDKTTFDHYLMLARDAFTALGQNSIGIDNIEELTEDSFPNVKIQQLKQELEKENSIIAEFEQVNNCLNAIKPQDGNQVESDKWQRFHMTFYLKSVINGLPSIKKDEQIDKRKKDLKLLLSCLQEELKMDVLENLNAERQSVACIICKEQIFSRAVYFILTDKGVNSDCVDAASASVNGRDPDVFLFSPASDPKKKSPFVVLWKTPSVLEMKELSHMSSTLHESFLMLFLHSQFQKNCVVGQDFYLEVMLPAYATSSLCTQIDYLPLLVELELSESNKDCSNIDSIVNSPSVHVSYFSYSFSNRRHAEFVFDNLICSLGKLLTLTEVQHVVISPLYNAAIFFFLEAKFSNSSLSVVVENNSVIVKCRSSICEFESTCNCLLVRNTLESKMESLSHDFRISLKSFNLQLHCEEADVHVSHYCKYVNRETLLSETGNGCACARRSGPDYVLEGEQNKDETNIEHANLGDAALDRPLWWFLGYGDLHAVVSYRDEVPLSDSAHCDESKQLDTSLCSNSSLNSCPITPCDPAQEAPDFHEHFSDNSSMASVDCSASNLAFRKDSSQLSFGVNNLQDCSVMRSSYEEGLHVSLKSEKDLSDRKTRKVDLLEDTVEETREEHKCGLQDFHLSYNTESGAMPCTAPQGISEPLLPGNKDGTAVAMLISKLQSDVAFYQHQCDEERQRSSALEEKLKQTEEEKQQLEFEVGRHQFLECKEKRSGKILHSCPTLLSEQSCTVSGGSPAFTGTAEKLLGGAGTLQDPRSHPLTGQTTSDRRTESVIPPRENSLDLLPENPSQNSSGDNLLQRQSSYEEGLATAEGDPVTETRETDAQYMPQLCHPTDGEFRDGVGSLHQSKIRKPGSERKRRFLSAKSKDDVVRLITTAAERDSQEQIEWLQTELQENEAENQILQAELKRISLPHVERISLPGGACSLPRTSTGSHPATGQNMLDKITESTVIPLKDRNLDLLTARQQVGCDETLDGMHIQDNGGVSGINETGPVPPNMSCKNSENSGSDINSDSEDSSVHPHFPDSSSGVSISNEGSSATVSSSELSSAAESMRVESTSSSSCMAHSVCDSSPRVTSDQLSAVKNCERFSDISSYNPSNSEEEILESTVSNKCESAVMNRREDYAAKHEEIGEVSESSGYVSDRLWKPPHLKMKGAACAAKDVVDCGPLCSPERVQDRAKPHVPCLMQDVLPDGDISVEQNASSSFNGAKKDTIVEQLVSDVNTQSKQYERLGARPRDRPPVKMSAPPKPSLIDLVPQEVTVANGLANAFLARHSQDQSLHESLCQGSAVKLLSEEASSQGAFYMDGMKHSGEPNKAKPYLGDCQVVPRPDVDSRWMFPPPVPGGEHDSYNAVGGYLYNTQLNTQLSGHVGPLSSYLTGGASNVPSSSAFNSSNYNSFRSDFALSAREPYLPLYGQVDFGLNTSVSGDQRLHSGMTASHLANGSLMAVAGPELTPPVHVLQRYSSHSDNASTMVAEREKTNSIWKANSRQTSLGNMAHPDIGSSGLPAPPIAIRSNGADNRHVSEAESRRTSQYALGTGRSNAFSTSGDRVVSGANRDVDNTHTGGALLSAGSRGTRLVASGNEHSNLEPRGAEASLISANTGSMLNRDFGTDSVESTDNSLLALEQRVEEACALVERVLREREEREQFGKEIERKEREIREQRARKKREREAREQEEASRWPQQQEAITGRSQWLCEHYQRHCRVRFPCCSYFYPCHRCHNNSKACKNEEAKACHATHLKCSICQHEQEIGEDSGKCRSCGAEMSAYFCSICKHFTSVDKNPYHCKKCGICRIHKDKSFHCEVCNVCLDKRLEGKHKCRPDSGHDECCICLEDAFSGCQILPCSHKVHRECALAMIQNNIRTCPVCRHPLYSQTSE